MGEKEKVTTMVLKVDLQCHKCYKKVKKVLCKFPQIRDQIYDEKQNQVVIKVVCCSPEKIRDKICCKGGSVIKSIKIKEPEKLKPPSKDDDKKKDPIAPRYPAPARGDEKHEKDNGKPTIVDGEPKDDSKPKYHVVPGYPPPVQVYYMDCYQGHAGGPCYSGSGGEPAPYIHNDGYYGRPVYDSYGGGNMAYCVTRSDYFSEENPSACTVM